MVRQIKIYYNSDEDSYDLKKPNIVVETSENVEKNPVLDMIVLCEALVLLIHGAHKDGIKKDYESVKSCISHIKMGFADESFRVEAL